MGTTCGRSAGGTPPGASKPKSSRPSTIATKCAAAPTSTGPTGPRDGTATCGRGPASRLPLPKDPRGGDGNLREQWRAALQQGGAARALRGVFWMLARLQPRLDLNSVREKGGGKVAIIFRFSSCILRVWARL